MDNKKINLDLDIIKIIEDSNLIENDSFLYIRGSISDDSFNFIDGDSDILTVSIAGSMDSNENLKLILLDAVAMFLGSNQNKEYRNSFNKAISYYIKILNK